MISKKKYHYIFIYLILIQKCRKEEIVKNYF